MRHTPHSLAAVSVALLACSEEPKPIVGALVELPLAPARDPAFPFRHAAEPSIAVRDGRIVVASVQMSAPEGVFPGTLLSDDKVVGVSVSEDGLTFSPAIVPEVPDSRFQFASDPVVRVSENGTFWLSTVAATQGSDTSRLVRSTDGVVWTGGDIEGGGDKPWIATAPDSGVYLSAEGGLWRFDPEGRVLASESNGPRLTTGGYADELGAHFCDLSTQVVRWDGQHAVAVERGIDRHRSSSGAVGLTEDGRQWQVYTKLDSGAPSASLFVRDLDHPGEEAEVAVSPEGAVALLPTATRASDGHIYAVYYDSSGPRGVLAVVRSRTTRPEDGFGPPVVVDPDAIPGDGWIPDMDERRLREYIDIAADGDRIHLVWTRAVRPPSRVFTAVVEWR